MESGNLSGTADKLPVTFDVLSKMGYDAVGLGSYDIRFIQEFCKRAAERKIAVVDAAPDSPSSAVPYLIKRVNGVRVGIVSFRGHAGVETDNSFTTRKSFYVAFKAARDASDILIVLDQANMVNKEWLDRNAKRFGTPDIVIGGIERANLIQKQVVGKTHIVPTSLKGVTLGVINIEIPSGGEPDIKVASLKLDSSVAEDETVLKMVKSTTEKAVNMAKRAMQTPAQVAEANANQPGPPRTPYYPARLCKGCHTKQYDNWATTPHAKAAKTLADQDKLTPECLTCHSDMFRLTHRLTTTGDQGPGVECASCHMNSLPHGTERSEVAAKSKVDPKNCLSCHTKERSPDYDEKTYLPRVAHAVTPSTITAAKPQ